jgi:hypothetical protein
MRLAAHGAGRGAHSPPPRRLSPPKEKQSSVKWELLKVPLGGFLFSACGAVRREKKKKNTRKNKKKHEEIRNEEKTTAELEKHLQHPA